VQRIQCLRFVNKADDLREADGCAAPLTFAPTNANALQLQRQTQTPSSRFRLRPRIYQDPETSEIGPAGVRPADLPGIAKTRPSMPSSGSCILGSQEAPRARSIRASERRSVRRLGLKESEQLLEASDPNRMPCLQRKRRGSTKPWR